MKIEMSTHVKKIKRKKKQHIKKVKKEELKRQEISLGAKRRKAT